MTMQGGVLVNGLGGEDPLRLLLQDPALVIATDPCEAHRAVFQLRLAAVKCLSHREFIHLGVRDRWARLLPRFRWLVNDRAMAAWDGRVESLQASRIPTSDEFEILKERATRIELVARPLDDLLAELPSGFAAAVVPGAACGCDPSRLRAQMRRVIRKVTDVVRTSPPACEPAGAAT
jgi:hypothetical protein